MIRRTILLLLFACLILALGRHPAGVQAQEPHNLLGNPGFEDGFYRWNGISELNVANGWTPWWIENPDNNPTYFRPEFKDALARDFPYRVRTGQSAQQWFKLYSSFFAGIYQQVFDVTPGTNYRFSVWAQVWSSLEDNPPTVSTQPANPHLQIGIDPTGNWDPFSPEIVWSFEAGMNQVIDQYGFLSVEATAQNNVITVFVRSRPEFANKHNNIYIDDASLAAVGPPPPPPTNTPLPPTETPVASPTPPVTNTPLPTSTPEPSPTAPPSDTPPPPTATSAPPTETATAEPSATAIPSGTPAATPTAEEVADVAPTRDPEQVQPTAEPVEPAPAEQNSGSGLCGSPLLGMLLLGVVLLRRRDSRIL